MYGQNTLKRLSKKRGPFLKAGLIRLKQVKSILQSNRDQLPEQLDLDTDLPQDHENIRGPHTFH